MAGLGEILVQQGVLTPDQLQQAETAAASSGGTLARTLVELRMAGEADLMRALAVNVGLPYAEVDGGAVDPQAAAMLPAEVQQELTALPVGFDDQDRLLVAVADPYVEGLAERLQQETGAPVQLALAPRGALNDAIAHMQHSRRRQDERKLLAQLKRNSDSTGPQEQAKDEVELLRQLQERARQPDIRRTTT